MASLAKRRRDKASRQAADTQARYDAAGFGRRLKGWLPPNTGPQRAVAEGFDRLRARALDAGRNDWAASSSSQKWGTNLVGVGIQPRWADERYREIWDDMARNADADSVLDVYGLQTLGAVSWVVSGEVFLRHRPRALTAPLDVPVQFQLIESHFVPLWDFDAESRLPKGNTVRQGIERNKYGRRTAVWMYREHPGDPRASNEVDPLMLIRVPASEIRHIFEPKRPGQLRGVTEFASILTRLRNAGNFEDAVLDRQLLANLFVATLRRDMPPNWADIDTDAVTGLPKWYSSAGNAMMALQPGITQELAPGEHLDFNSPPPAAASHPDYMRTTHLGTAAGQGLPYEIMSGDIRDVSDRAMRIVIQEFRRFCEQRQWQILIPMLCQPMVDWTAEAAVLAGRLAPSEVKAFRKCEWSPQGWDYIHPVQDVEAALKARDGGLTSTSRLISRRGDDPRVILRERQADEASGLTPKPPEPAGAAPGAQKPDPEAVARTAWFQAQTASFEAQLRLANAPRATAPEEPSDIEHFIAGLAGVSASIGEVAASVAALAAKPTEIHNHVASPTVNVEPTPVTVENHVAGATVNVEPTPVTVENNVAAPTVNVTNEVQPADVVVDVNLPARQTVSEIVRDSTGEITSVTQTERTLQ